MYHFIYIFILSGSINNKMSTLRKSKKANNLMRNRNISFQEKHNKNTEYLRKKNHGK